MSAGVGAHLQAHVLELLVAQGLILEIPTGARVVDLCRSDDLAEEVVEPAYPALESGYWFFVRAEVFCFLSCFRFEPSGEGCEADDIVQDPIDEVPLGRGLGRFHY
jgi:hypothetical protein